MAKAWDAVPSKTEVADQLREMLSSKRFRKAPSQRKFLKLVVERKLDGKASSEDEIGPILFPGFVKDEATNVRTIAVALRKTLAKYNDNEGKSQLVIITLPDPQDLKGMAKNTGEAYTPDLSYNQNHRVSKEFSRGEFYLRRGMFEDCWRAQCHFFMALQLAPNHIGARIGIVEAVCRSSLWRPSGVAPSEARGLIKTAAAFLERAYKLAPGFWRVYAIGGFIFMLLNQFEDAREFFENAALRDRKQTESFIPYFYFLMASGNEALAIDLAQKFLDRNGEDLAGFVAYALLLWRSDNRSRAVAVMEEALYLDKGFYGVHYLLGFMRMSFGTPSEELYHMEMLSKLADPTTVATVERWRATLGPPILPDLISADT